MLVRHYRCCALTKRQAGIWSTRSFHSSTGRQVQRLLWAGSVLDRATASLQEVPKDWLLSLGVQADVEQGISFNYLAASPSHSLITYTTLPPSLPVSADDHLSKDEFGRSRLNPSGLHKIIAVGRNTFGELGLGFSSQESTWGMVTTGFGGKGGIKSVQCGLGTSWLATANTSEKDSTSLIYTFGNHTSGQLALGGATQSYTLSEGGEPQLQLFSSPRKVEAVGQEDERVEKVSVGLDHTVLLVRTSNGSQAVLTCGVNTDGQLGDDKVRINSPTLCKLDFNTFRPPYQPLSNDPIVGVAAGGDSSLLWTASGRVWAWGNSEYGQCLVESKAIDRIDRPTEASQVIAQHVEAKIVDVCFGGCFIVLLDERGNVYTAGFGALGQGKDSLESHKPQKILSHATSISAGLEQASAVVKDPKTNKEQLMVWGLDTPAGRLGIGGRKPWPSYMIASRFTPDVVEHRLWQPSPVTDWKDEWTGNGEPGTGVRAVAHGRDVMWVLVEDGKQEMGRWAAR